VTLCVNVTLHRYTQVQEWSKDWIFQRTGDHWQKPCVANECRRVPEDVGACAVWCLRFHITSSHEEGSGWDAASSLLSIQEEW